MRFLRLVFAFLAVLGVVRAADRPPRDAELARHDAAYRNHYGEGDLAPGLQAARAGLERARSLGDVTEEIGFLRHLAYGNWLMGNSASSIDYSHELLALADRLGDDDSRSRAHRYLSQAYASMNVPDQARAHAREALRFGERAGDPGLRAHAWEALGHAVRKLGDLDEAERNFASTLAHWRSVGAKWNITLALDGLALVLEERGDFVAALALHRQIFDLRVGDQNRRGQVRALVALGRVLRRLGRLDEAAARLEEGRVLIEPIGGHGVLADLHEEIALVAEARGDFSAALVAQRKASAERLALAGETAQARAVDLAARLDLARKQRAIDELTREKAEHALQLRTREAELARARWQRYGLLAILLLGGVVAAAIVSRHRLKLASERRLRAQSELARIAAEEASLLKSRLLGIASHDLKSPLRAIALGAERLDEAAADPEQARRLAGWLRRESARLVALVGDLIDLAALETGGIRFSKTAFDLLAVAREAVGAHRSAAEAKAQSLVFESGGPAEIPVIAVGDPARLRQTLDNLIGNAVKFTPPARSIRVRVMPGAEVAACEVSDEGPGFRPEDFAGMFQPFTRLSARPTGGEESTGLGLYIARELVTRQGGRLLVSSIPGRGATIRVELPAAPPAEIEPTALNAGEGRMPLRLQSAS